MTAWRKTTLGEVIELKRGYDLPQQSRKGGKVPVVSSSGISGTHSEAKCSAPGVVTGRYGTIGKVFYLTENFWPLNTTLYVRDFKDNDPRFISYFLRQIDFLSCSDKAAVPGVNRNHLHAVAVTVPPLAEQKAIAFVLGALDDKIELNRRMNATLEAMARALFQSWFVDFDPVHAKQEGRTPSGLDESKAGLFPGQFQGSEIGTIPQGWEIRSLDEVADYLNGLALQKFPPGNGETLPVIKIAQLRRGDSQGADRCNTDLPSEYIVADGDVLFSWSGTLEVELWCGGPGALNQHLFKVTSDKFPKWFYFQWTRHHLEGFRRTAANKATTMGHIQRKHLKDAKVLVPPAELLIVMDKYMAPLIARVVENRIESRLLTLVRDTLLPPLLSGEILPPQAAMAAANV
jgi:type I restriction enzyme S subunit